MTRPTTAARLDDLEARIGTLENFRSMVEFQIMNLNDQVAALTEALKLDGGAKRRAQELKARRLFEVLEDWGIRSTVGLSEGDWNRAMDDVNDRYRSYHKPPSPETKALVTEMFAKLQSEADR